MYSQKPVPYEEALERAGHGKLQRWVTFAGAMCLLCSYVAVSMVSLVLPLSQCDLQLSSQGKGAIIASGFVGIILSSHLWGFLSDTLGRRYILTRCLFADGILYILSSFVPNFWLFLIMRLFNGFSSCGGVVSAWAYIGEFHTNEHRTRSIMTASVIATLIYFLLPCLAWLVCPLPIEIPLFTGMVFRSWRLFYMLCGVPSLLTSILMMVLPESPKFLLANGEKEKAISVLRYVYTENTGRPAENLMIADVCINEQERLTKLDGSPKGVTAFFHKMYNQTIPLFKKPLNFNFSLLCTMQFMLYFCNNGMFLWIPETVNRLAQYRDNNPNQPGTFCQAVENYKTTKINAIHISTKIRHEVTSSFNFTSNNFVTRENYETKSVECNDNVDFSVYTNSAVIGLLTGGGLIVMIFLMKLLSRKFVLGSFITVSVITTISLLFFDHVEYVFILVSIMVVLTGSGIPVVTSIVVDVFPTNLRAMAVCLSLLAGRFGTIVSSQIVGSVLDTRCNIIVYCFIVLLTICIVLIAFIPGSSTSTECPKRKRNESIEHDSVLTIG